MKGIFAWTLNHRIRIIIYIVMMCVTIGVCYYYIINEIETDRDSLFVLGDGSYEAAGYNLNKIIHYELDSIPQVEDESKRQQMYGDYENYFKISGGWYILMLKRDGDVILKYRIYPFAAITNWSNPVNLIKETRDAAIECDEYHCNDYYEYRISNIDGKETKFYKFERNNFTSDNNNEDVQWWNFDSGKGFVKKELACSYQLVEKESDIFFFQLKCYTIGLLIYMLIVLLINWTIRKCVIINNRIKRKFSKAHGRNKTLDSKDVEKLYQKLRLEIHPSNYFNPYNPEKVRIANDLLEALENNKGNRTIIEMIRDKAVKSLGIDSLRNDNNLLL